MYDLVAIGDANEDVIKRSQQIASSFGFSFGRFQNAEVLLDGGPALERSLAIVLSAVNFEKSNDIASAVQTVKFAIPNAYFVVVLGAKLKQEDAEFVKKSGASLVLMEVEVTTTSKLEFILSQKVRSTHIPIKVSEMVEGAVIDCNVYHLLALNKKWVPVIRAGEEIPQKRLEKLKEVSEVYILKEDVKAFNEYTSKHQDRSAKGLASRCRAQFLSLSEGFTELLLLISDRSEYSSFEKGRRLYDEVVRLADELMGNLGAVGDAWEIVSNSAIGDFGSVERSPAIAAYAGLLSLHNGVGNHVDVMVAALLANVGLLDLSPSITYKCRLNQQDQFTAEERAEYIKHPLVSLNQCLARRLPLNENIKNAIQYSHERSDGKGFPAGLSGTMIPDEASLIQLCEMIDQKSLIKMGQERPKIKDVRKKIFESEFVANATFSVLFTDRVKASFLS